MAGGACALPVSQEAGEPTAAAALRVGALADTSSSSPLRRPRSDSLGASFSAGGSDGISLSRR